MSKVEPVGPTGVQLVWRRSGDVIDLQNDMTYAGVQAGIYTFEVPVCAYWWAALKEGQLEIRMDALPPRTQLGVVRADEEDGEG